MAEKYYSKYTAEEIEQILNDSDLVPFVIYYDKTGPVYRFFRTKERRDAWLAARDSGEMTEEIASYEFTGSFTAPAPYTINISGLEDNQYFLYGSKGIYLEYTFQTMDGNAQNINESVDVYYTIKTPVGTSTTSNVYNAGQTVRLNIDEYLALGTNVITLLIRGRSTGTTRTQVITYYVVELSISSTFKFYEAIPENRSFIVDYIVRGQHDKTVDFYIDGSLEASEPVYQIAGSEVIRSRIFDNTLDSTGRPKWGPGRHTLQIRARMNAGNQQFYSNLLYYEFVITGKDQTVILIKEVFPPSTQPSTQVIVGTTPGLTGEQYVSRTLDWAYYSSDRLQSNVIVTWRLYVKPEGSDEGHETTLATRNADVVSAESDKAPEPLNFMPTEVGDYQLQAIINGQVIEPSYTISIIANTNNLYETTEGMTMKLSGLGRSNDEPADTLTSWTNRGYSAEFFNVAWNDNNGWKDDALVLNNGSTARIDNMPFSGGRSDTVDAADKRGCVFEIDFETFNVTNNDCILANIGIEGETETRLIIKPSEATLKSRLGTMKISTKFKSDERVKLAFVVYPKGSTGASPYRNKNYIFIYNNGVMSACQEYNVNDDFVTNTFIELGNALVRDYQGNESSVCGTIPENTTVIGCDAGIKIYYIRTYNTFINMYSELNNYIIDSGVNLTQLVTKNDIYTPNTRQISVDKLEGTITTVKITGDLDNLINKNSKNTITAGLEVVSPNDSTINMHCEKAEFKTAGQSTLDKPIPSLHVKLDKNNNVCYDRDGKILNKNRWAFRQGNVPEKKFRLQANYMDSSGVHNGAFLRLFDEVSQKVTIEGKKVLRTPAEQFAYEDYPAIMTSKYGADKDPRGLGWAFPYNLHMVPDSIPCVVVWRKTDKDPFIFLGQYVLMEEKKSNFTNGMRSIYDTVDIDGYPDPFQFKTKGGTKLWDNAGCHQVELLTSTDDLTLFLDDSKWNNTTPGGSIRDDNVSTTKYPERVKNFEIVYPDIDDITDDEIEQEWNLFHDTFLYPVCSTKGDVKYGTTISAAMQGDQEAFNKLYGTCINKWHFAAYYCLMLRNCCSDSLARNMELTTYDTIINPNSGDYEYGVDDKPWGGWIPKWWDVDMQCGLYQNGSCDLKPMTTRTTIAPGTDRSFALSGRGYVGGVIHSSWLWDGLENCPQFQADVKTMDAELYNQGWNYTRMSEFFDKEYADYWSQALYNESGITKYLDFSSTYPAALISLQGDRTSHRHWFLKTSYDYFDAVNVCGEYTSKTINVRTEIPYIQGSEEHTITLKAGADSFLGWGTSISKDLTGLQVSKGETKILVIDRALNLNNPLHIYAANKLAEIDLSDISQYMAADLDLGKTYDSITGTYLRKVILGIPPEQMTQGVFNKYSTLNSINGIDNLVKVEYLDIRGLTYIRDLNFSNMGELKELYAAGTSMTNFNPANGSNITVAELPTTVVTIGMERCSLTNNNNCSISWYKTIILGAQEVTRYYQRVVGGWARLAGTPTDPISGTVYSMTELEESTELALMGSIYKVIITESIMSIESSTVPTTLSTLSFRSMGSDIGTKKLIVDWVRAIAAEEAVLIEEAEQNETPYSSIWNNYRLTYTNINGNVLADIDNDGIMHRPEGVFEVSDLLNIAKIPPSNRTLTGYIIARGTGVDLYGDPDGSFTSEEMNLLMNAFGDDIFRLGSILCIDCATGGVVISAVGSNTDVDQNGTIRVLQGTSATLSASGFPLLDRDPIYIWSILVPNENPSLQDIVIKANDINNPEVLYQNLVLNCYTGALSVTEDDRDNYSFKIKVDKFSGEQKTGEAERNMTILKRSYPSEATINLSNFDPSTDTEVVEYINGVYQLKANATYIFDVEFSPSNYNGNFIDNGNFWTLANSDSKYIERVDSNYADGKNRNNQFKLVVKQLPEVELNPTLMYAATWKNSSITQATPINLSLVKIVDVLVNSTNDILFQVLDRYGIQHAKQYYFSSLELKKATGTINFAELAAQLPALPISQLTSLNGGNGTSATVYNIASYLINVEGLNLDNCTGLNTDIDISESKTNYRTLSMVGTTVNAIIGTKSKLEELHLGTPTTINIVDPINLESTGLSVESSNALTSIVVNDLKDKKTFTGTSSIVSNAPNLTHVDIRQDTTIVEIVKPEVVENLAAMIDKVGTSLDSTSGLIGHIWSNCVYRASREKILRKFAASGNILGLTIDFKEEYVPFIDLAFRSAISEEFGDSVGVTQSQAVAITSLGTILQNNTQITNLSDLYDKLTNLNFSTDNTAANATFLGCSNLSAIKFPSSVTKLGAYTFSGNDNLETIDFSLCTGLTRIEENAFNNCNSNNVAIDLSSCSSLTYANLYGLINPEEITIVGNNSITTLVI